MDELPSTPAAAAQSALLQGAQDMAADRARRELRSRIPRFLWPLIPGQGGDLRESTEKEAKRAVSRWVSSLLFSIFFFVVFGGLVCAVLTFVVGVLGYAWLTF